MAADNTPVAASHVKGLVPWLQVLASFCIFFVTWGNLNTFGAFQAYYQQTYLSNYRPTEIAWIGTVQGFLMIFVGTVSGPLYDMGYVRSMIAVGAGLVVLGLMTASVATEYYSIFLSLSVAVGLGGSLLYTPCISLISAYFEQKRRPVATGLASLGAGLGSVILPIAFQQVLEKAGFGWACRTLGFICGFLLLISFLVARPILLNQGAKRRLADPTAFRDIPFLIYCFGTFLGFIGMFVPYVFMPLYGESRIGMSPGLAFYLLSITGAGSVIGRIIPPALAMRLGVFPMMIGCMTYTTILNFVWGSVNTSAGLIVYAVLYGFGYGGMTTIIYPLTTQISPNMKTIGTRFGMLFAFAAVGLLIGSPVAGAIAEEEDGFAKMGYFSGACLLGSTIFICITWFLVERRKTLQFIDH